MSHVRLSQVDDLSRVDHYYLARDDEIFYLREYTSEGWKAGETNSWISNLKKPLERKGKPDWPYKAQAIQQFARELTQAVTTQQDLTWVPVPPSRAKTDPGYDDRLLQVLRSAFPTADVRELVEQVQSLEAFHQSESPRPDPQTLKSHYRVSPTEPHPKILVVFDDMLTTGSHFKAMQAVLSDVYPDARIVGLFLARRIFPAADPGAVP